MSKAEHLKLPCDWLAKLVAVPGISDTKIGVSRPRPVFPDCWSRCRDRDRDFSPCGLNVETDTETLLSPVSISRPRLFLLQSQYRD
jgi:hypothetical protein